MSEWPSPESVANGLGNSHRNGDEWIAVCPAHDDKNPSLSLGQDSDGKLLVYCHAGCPQDAIIEALKDRGLWRRAETPTKDRSRPSILDWVIVLPVPADIAEPDFSALCRGKPSVVYEYRDAGGTRLGYICRLETDSGQKTFLPITFWRKGSGHKWQLKGFPKPRPLYGLDRLAQNTDKPVLVVEGEKATDEAAKKIKTHIVISWPGGAKAANKANWSPLKGRDVVIWPDADEPGRKAAIEVSRFADEVGASSAKIVQLPADLPHGWDLADDVPDGLNIAKLVKDAKRNDGTIARHVITAQDLRVLDIPEREYVIEPFMPTDSLSLLFASRGVGKTWIALTLALSVIRGESFLAYKVPKPRRVLFIDGEMAISDLKGRLILLDGGPADDMLILPSETMHREDQPLNINNEDDQKRVMQMLDSLEQDGRRPSLIIFDNLSSLGGGVDENDNSALDSLLRWLISLRHFGYAVLLVHHAGKSGDQRGASRREDFLETSIKLTLPDAKESVDRSGAIFDLEFAKVRGITPDPERLRLALRKSPEGNLEWYFSPSVKASPHIETLRMIYEGVIENGREGQKDRRPYCTQNELAESSKIAKGTVSKHLQILRTEHLATKLRNGNILVTATGFDELQRIYGNASIKSADRATVEVQPDIGI